jgi:succinate-semialdehyde dehydrogenase / glutarate-semialdehyde dehydrogenase
MTTSDDEQRVLAEVPKQLFIGGEWRDTADGSTFAVEDPATGRTLVNVADGKGGDALAALDAADSAQSGWAATPPRVRGEILRKTYEILSDRVDDLALLMTLEMGKPLAESRAEITYAAEFLRWFSEEAVRIDGRYTVEPNGRGRLLVMRQPVGPCLLITPWNFPMAMATRKLGPAIAAGCTIVLKPAELTPLSTLALTDILTTAGLPPGVLNVVTTSDPGGTTTPVIADRRLRKLSFTGSTPVGKSLIVAASEQLLRVSMELGGNAPFLVFADADLDAAVEGALVAKLRNVGEACTAANRFLVHESVAKEFGERLAQRFAAMKVGRGTEPGVEIGPLIEHKAREKLVALVDEAKACGATVATGGQSVSGEGYFFAPTVLTDVPPESRLLNEEIFGPVAPVVSFASVEEGIRAANATEYGLVAYVYTTNIETALNVTEALEVGMVGLNQGLVSNPAAPFGGVKHSGFGREGGKEGIEEYLDTKYVAVHL